MISNTLKVEASSHCTTPSDRVDPDLVTVKMGCLDIDHKTKRGRQRFLVQMLVLCFVPYIALLIQNCVMMGQLSHTLDSALYLNQKTDTVLSVGELVTSLQEERRVITELLFQQESMVNRQAKNASLQGTLVYAEVTRELLGFVTSQVKVTTSDIWRLLSLCYELLSAIEEMTLAIVSYTYHSSTLQPGYAAEAFHRSAVEHLSSASQLLKIEGLVDEATVVDDVAFSVNQSMFRPRKEEGESTANYVNNIKHYLMKLKDIQIHLWIVVRKSVNKEVWAARRTLAVGVTVLVLVLMAWPVLIVLLKRTVLTIQVLTQSIDASTQRLMAEKQKSDLLLSRMLPLPVLRRLRAQRTVPAESFDAVTIFFSDIVGFTTISAYSTPMEVINMLNQLYRLFDEKIQQYNVYKVETIGDAYMVVSGLPQRNGNRHASEIADMSLSLMRSLLGATVPHKCDEPLRIRAGINTGPCVAGVVGTTMPRYCLFGDTINTASRMESNGEAMKIHISDSTKQALDTMGNYEVESRGMLDIPGKGKMETFWLLRKIHETENDSPKRLLNDYDQNILEIIINN